VKKALKVWKIEILSCSKIKKKIKKGSFLSLFYLFIFQNRTRTFKIVVEMYAGNNLSFFFVLSLQPVLPMSAKRDIPF